MSKRFYLASPPKKNPAWSSDRFIRVKKRNRAHIKNIKTNPLKDAVFVNNIYFI